jgi:hypothetical protein
MRTFATKNDDDPKTKDEELFEQQKKAKKTRRGSATSTSSTDEEETTRKVSKKLVEIVNDMTGELPKKRKRRTKAEIEADKVTAKIEDAQKRVR